MHFTQQRRRADGVYFMHSSIKLQMIYYLCIMLDSFFFVVFVLCSCFFLLRTKKMVSRLCCKLFTFIARALFRYKMLKFSSDLIVKCFKILHVVFLLVNIDQGINLLGGQVAQNEKRILKTLNLQLPTFRQQERNTQFIYTYMTIQPNT